MWLPYKGLDQGLVGSVSYALVGFATGVDMAVLTLAEHLRVLEAELRAWQTARNGSSDKVAVMLDHWATRLAALAVMAEKR